MDNLSAADIDCDVVDFAIFRIKYQIARLCFRKADLLAALCLASGIDYGAYYSDIRSALTDAITNVVQNGADVETEIQNAQDTVEFNISE